MSSSAPWIDEEAEAQGEVTCPRSWRSQHANPHLVKCVLPVILSDSRHHLQQEHLGAPGNADSLAPATECIQISLAVRSSNLHL